MRFEPKTQQRPSVKDVGCQTCTTVSQWAFTFRVNTPPSLFKQSSDEGVKTGQKIAYYF